MQTVQIRFFDGKTSQAHNATLGYQAPFLYVQFDGQINQYQVTQMQYLPPMQGVAAGLLFDDGAKVEFLDTPPDWLPTKERKIFANIAKFEQSWRWALAGVMMAAAAVFGVFRYGLPMAADYVAYQLPDDLLVQVGDEAEKALFEETAKSKLSAQRQAEILALYQRLDAKPVAKIVFRSAEGYTPNAFALPNHTIILTDKLVEMTNHDHEILAVLAHEQGHLVHKHSLRKVINLLGTSALIAVVLGDASDLVATLPVLFVNLHYSHDFEMQADKHAIDELRRLGISPMYMADVINNLSKYDDDEESGLWAWLSTHPSREKRVKQVVDDVLRHKAQNGESQ